MENEFAAILRRLGEHRPAYLERTAEGRRYRRAFLPGERLILLGAGHVAQALAPLAARLDFEVTVADDRSAFANREKFPDAAEIVCDAFPAAIHALGVRGGDAVCVLTRGHRWDAECLRALLPGEEPGYLGMIGSHRRVAMLLQMLEEEGFPPERLRRIHAPIGLPIKALTPTEIAVSIAAELILSRRSRARDEACLEQTNADLAMLRFAADTSAPRAMLLVLATSGSTPVKPGAMMVTARDGRAFGTVGGGCGEAEALARARRLVGTGGAEVLSVDLTNEDAAEEGMVCGGTMRLLLEDLPVCGQEG